MSSDSDGAEPAFKPQFIKALESDSHMIMCSYDVDPQESLDIALLLLTHFAANVPRTAHGGILEIATNFLIVPGRAKIPEWFGHHTGFLTETRAVAKSVTPTLRPLLSNHEVRSIRDEMRHLARYGMLFAQDVEILREYVASDQKPRSGRFMLGTEDGPLMPETGMRSHVALALDGPGHLRVLRTACRRSRKAILHRFGRHHAGRFVRLSLLGWCDLATVMAAMRADDDGGDTDWLTCNQSDLPAAPPLPGRPLLLPAPHDGPWGSRYPGMTLTQWTPLSKGLSRVFCVMVQERFLHEQFRFNPDTATRDKLREARAAESAAIGDFPAPFRAWAEPVDGLSRALVVLFLMLGMPRDGPGEPAALTDLALEVATRIRQRSLNWLRHVLAAELTPGLSAFDRALYEKLLARGPQGTRDLCRAFHRMKREQLDETMARLEAAGLVERSDGMARARDGAGAAA